MARLTILAGDQTLTVETETGTLLSDALLHSGHRPDMPCGGKGRCGKCRVRASGGLSPLSSAEREALTPAEQAAGVRLACCTRILGDAQVTVDGDGAVSQICTQGEARELPVLDPLFTVLGAAVDIGTTTLAAQLYDRSGLLATAAAPNPQRAFGADVISRIGRSMDGDGPGLAACVRQAIADMLRDLCRQAGRETGGIDALVLTGNTAMLHLLCGLDASPLAAAPFEAKELFGKFIPAAELELPCAPEAQVYLPRCMSAFVGADITTALLASGICGGGETRMLADIGTNGEIALWHGGRLSCCSTAAGPAFEGANLSQGMQGAPAPSTTPGSGTTPWRSTPSGAYSRRASAAAASPTCWRGSWRWAGWTRPACWTTARRRGLWPPAWPSPRGMCGRSSWPRARSGRGSRP